MYENSFISRFYLDYRDKTDKRKTKITESLKSIWANQALLIVEGENSRLGVGNDLFNNARSIERIICPAENAFKIYPEILENVKMLGKDKLILIALGATATILSYDLAKENYWAIDIGDIDIEYMWAMMSARQKSPVKGRLVYEVREQESFDINKEDKNAYEKSIILKINTL